MNKFKSEIKTVLWKRKTAAKQIHNKTSKEIKEEKKHKSNQQCTFTQIKNEMLYSNQANETKKKNKTNSFSVCVYLFVFYSYLKLA